MKKFLLAIIACFALIGCGQAKMTTTITENMNINGSLLGASNVQGFNVQNMTPSQNQTVSDVSYAILNNTGGAGTIALANVAYGTACPTTIPPITLANISIVAGTNVSLTSLGATTASTFNSLINTNYEICAYLTQANMVNPVNFTLQLVPTVQMVLNY